MHLLVLSAFRHQALRDRQPRRSRLNAPSGAQCFPTRDPHGRAAPRHAVSMHLLVLSAFRPDSWWAGRYLTRAGLNAPSGAQCFPTLKAHSHLCRGGCLNAPSGAQCFPTGFVVGGSVFDARRSQCTFWCSVLSDTESTLSPLPGRLSQCTFWCSVLSDLPKCRLS